MPPELRATASRTVARAPDEIARTLADLATMEAWMTGVSDVSLESGTPGETGAVYDLQYSFSGRTEPMSVELTAVEPGNRVAFRAREGPFPFAAEFTVDEAGARSRLTARLTVGSDSRFTALMFTVFRPVLRWLFARQLGSDLDSLTSGLESGSIGPESHQTSQSSQHPDSPPR